MSERTCTIPGCAKPLRVISRGLCGMHYAKWQKYGDPLAGRTFGTNPDVCTFDGCNRPYAAGGYCNAHYLRSRNGSPMGAPMRDLIRDPIEAFAARTEWRGDCLVWTGNRNAYGYGIQSSGRSRTEGPMLAHRWAWEREHGPVPDGMDLDHQCWNRACVNVKHLRVATRSQNNANKAGASSESATGVRNVYRKRNKFRVQIAKGGVLHYFGVYSDIREAAAVAERERAQLFGEFAGRS